MPVFQRLVVTGSCFYNKLVLAMHQIETLHKTRELYLSPDIVWCLERNYRFGLYWEYARDERCGCFAYERLPLLKSG